MNCMRKLLLATTMMSVVSSCMMTPAPAQNISPGLSVSNCTIYTTTTSWAKDTSADFYWLWEIGGGGGGGRGGTAGSTGGNASAGGGAGAPLTLQRMIAASQLPSSGTAVSYTHL